jgi:hypothetical protein
MPKRIVDGEALWTSGKLKRVQPPEFRLHYANWLPLAEANGVFEVDFDIIRARVYPVIDPSFCSENVRHVYEEFTRVGLLQSWVEGGKKWAYFVGIEKSGRLPVEAHLKRYKNLPPSPPISVPDNPGLSGNSPEGFGSGLVLDRVGIGLEEEDVRIKNNITDKSRVILGVRIAPNDSNWVEIKALARVYGEDAVIEKFEQWAKTQTTIPNYPLSGFIRIADALLAGKFAGTASPEEVAALVADLAILSNGRVVFNNNQKAVLSGLLSTHSPADIKAAFQEYYGNIEGDDFEVRRAAKTFVEAAEQLLAVRAKRAADIQKTDMMVKACTAAEQEKARKEAEELARKEAEEAALAAEDDPSKW